MSLYVLQTIQETKNSIINNVGIKLELGDDENKNSNCVVDKAINELEEELKKICPSGGKIDTADLAQSVMMLNCKIRNRGLSASEIHFSRDLYDHSNLFLDDKCLSNKQKALRHDNHKRLAKSRTPHNIPIRYMRQ